MLDPGGYLRRIGAAHTVFLEMPDDLKKDAAWLEQPTDVDGFMEGLGARSCFEVVVSSMVFMVRHMADALPRLAPIHGEAALD